MSFTRFHDDPIRIRKGLQQSTGTSRYQLNAPGPGLNTPFMEDPQIRLQKWGANLRTNTINLESDLRGISHTKVADDKDYSSVKPITHSKIYSNSTSFVDESRASHPAWMYRDLEHSQWTTSFHDVQAKTAIPFQHNESTRILEKDKVRNHANAPRGRIIEGLDEEDPDPNGGGGKTLTSQPSGADANGTTYVLI